MDIKHNDTGDLDFGTGDITYVNGTRQHQQDVLITKKGELKRSPINGVGIDYYLNDDSPADMIREIKRQLKGIGQNVNSVIISTVDIQVDAEYANNKNS